MKKVLLYTAHDLGSLQQGTFYFFYCFRNCDPFKSWFNGQNMACG